MQAEDVRNDDLKIISIPKNLHEHFECVVGKHVFLDKPWTLISHKKIIDHLQLHSAKSCFWQFRKKLRVKQFDLIETILIFYFYTKEKRNINLSMDNVFLTLGHKK